MEEGEGGSLTEKVLLAFTGISVKSDAFTQGFSDIWNIDSGATFHIPCHREEVSKLYQHCTGNNIWRSCGSGKSSMPLADGKTFVCVRRMELRYSRVWGIRKDCECWRELGTGTIS